MGIAMLSNIRSAAPSCSSCTCSFHFHHGLGWIRPRIVTPGVATTTSNHQTAAADRHDRAASITIGLTGLVAGNGRRCWAGGLVAWNRLCLGSETLHWSAAGADELGAHSCWIFQGDSVSIAHVRS